MLARTRRIGWRKRKRAVPSGEGAPSPHSLRSGLAALTCRGRGLLRRRLPCGGGWRDGRGNHGSAAAHLLPTVDDDGLAGGQPLFRKEGGLHPRPNVTGRLWALPSLSTTKTILLPCTSLMACSGTSRAFWATPPSMRTLAKRPGLMMPSGLGNTARTGSVPVEGSMARSAMSMKPWWGYTGPSARTTVAGCGLYSAPLALASTYSLAT